MSLSEKNAELRATWRTLKSFGLLYAENLKLLSIEKATVLLGHAALAGVLAVLAIIAFFFISLALVFLLAQVLPVTWSFMIMGGVYVIMAVLAIIFRNNLFLNPISRFLTRLFMAPPKEAVQQLKQDNDAEE